MQRVTDKAINTLACRHDGSVPGGVPDIVQHDDGHGGRGGAAGGRAQCVAKAAEIPQGHARPGVCVGVVHMGECHGYASVL